MKKYAEIESIRKVNDEGFYEAIIGVRESLSSNFHGNAITVYASNPTELVARANKIINSFNSEGQK